MTRVVRSRRRLPVDDGLPDTQLRTPNVERFHMNDESGSYDMLKVTCPKSVCRGEFWVEPGKWLKGHEAAGRTYFTSSCPYCYSTMQRAKPNAER